jgi:predicted dehydrogenase
MLQVRFANGVLGEVLTSWAFERPSGTHQIHAVGDKGELFGSANQLFYRPAGYTEPARIDLAEADTFAEEVAHFADCLRRGKRPLHSVEEGRAVLEIILEATKDARGWEARAMRDPRVPRRARRKS